MKEQVLCTKFNATAWVFYIGETGRTPKTRLKEHRAACRLASYERSVIAEHAWQVGREIQWDNVDMYC